MPDEIVMAAGHRRPRVRAATALCGVFCVVLLAGCSGAKPRVEPPELEPVAGDMSLHGLWYRQPQIRHAPDETPLTPFVEGRRFFYSDRPDRVVALDARNGRRVWSTVLSPPTEEGPVRLSGGIGAGEGLLYVGTDEGEIIALDPDDGAVRWRTQLSGEVLAIPLARDGTLVVRTNDGHLSALDPVSGNPLWSYSSTVPALSLRGASRPLIDQGRVFAGFANGKLAALALDSGEVLWEVTVGVPEGRSELERMVDIDADPVLVDGVIYAAAYQARLVALTSVAGSVLWSRELSTAQDMASDADTLYLAQDDGRIFAISRRSGAILWQQDQLAGRMITAPVLYRDTLYVADQQGYLHGLSLRDGHFVARFHVSEDAIALTPVVSGDVMYLQTVGGALHALTIDP
ncbi:MAG: outer membrane protein assembly factor BamB [Gammaproteobacteria bacterium]|nr:outer membrane protein assembly factor BamB [Gammaproteobacteria bacterium]